MGNNDGFVLVEMLMDGIAVGGLLAVVALMAVQSVVAYPRWSDARERAYRDVLRRDLENVAAHQTLHRADHGSYAGSVEGLGFTPSEGVRVSMVASSRGWSATVRHDELTEGDGCAVYVGTASPPRDPVTPPRSGEIVCTG